MNVSFISYKCMFYLKATPLPPAPRLGLVVRSMGMLWCGCWSGTGWGSGVELDGQLASGLMRGWMVECAGARAG